jgi:hypothetical protein
MDSSSAIALGAAKAFGRRQGSKTRLVEGTQEKPGEMGGGWGRPTAPFEQLRTKYEGLQKTGAVVTSNVIYTDGEAASIAESKGFAALSFAKEFDTAKRLMEVPVYPMVFSRDYCGSLDSFYHNWLTGKCGENACVEMLEVGECVRPLDMKKVPTRQGFWHYKRGDAWEEAAHVPGGADYNSWWRLWKTCRKEMNYRPPVFRTEEMFPPGLLHMTPTLVYTQDGFVTTEGNVHKGFERYIEADGCYQVSCTCVLSIFIPAQLI